MKLKRRIQSLLQSAKRFSALFLVLGFTFWCTLSADAQKDEHKIKKIVIDAGHGGTDPGNIGTGRYKTTEKDISLDVSLRVGKYISMAFPEVKVVFTRETDVAVPLKKRTEIANLAKADLFISIHCNAATRTAAHGSETFVMGMHKTDDNLKLAQKENSVIFLEENYNENYAGFDNSPESMIGLSLLQSAHLSQSISLSSKVQDQFRDKVQRVDRGVKQAGFWVISYTTMPSILVELGFLSNAEEEDYLNSELGKDYMASAIYRAFKIYKEEVESINSSITKQFQEQPAPVVKAEEPRKSETIGNTAKAGTTSQDVVFKVQVVSSSTSIQLIPENFMGIDNVQEYQVDGVYKYTVGNEKTLDDALKVQAKVRMKGYGGAFIVAFKDEIRIDLKKALSLLDK